MQLPKPIIAALFALGAVTAQQKPYQEAVGKASLIIDMVPVPAGALRMGSPESEPGRVADEGPQAEVRVAGFWMSSHEITWDLYRQFLERPASEPPAAKGSEVALAVDAVSGATIPYVDMSLGMGTGEGLPVGNVTRRAAAHFCKWLSAKTGRFYRLPTEAEWEYAARAGSAQAYFFGNNPADLDRFAWYADNSSETYHRVGQKEPNPLGLYDIYGNVAEWTLDVHDPEGYTRSGMAYEPPAKEYPGVLRGGSYQDGPEKLRSAARLPSNPVWKQRDPQFPRSKWWFTDAPFAGFRIIRPFDPPPVSEHERFWDVR